VRPEIKTCPDCGALITPQLVKCRQCGRYLHCTKLEGLIFEHLLPESLRAAPGTGILMLACVLYYVLMVMFAGIQNVFGFTGYTLTALGAISVPEIHQGQWWRFVTSIFAHHDLMHIAFNLYALASVGRLVEEAFDKKKMMIIYLVSGSASMAISFAWYVFVVGNIWVVSAGASGAVCGMLGAALVAAHRLGPGGEHVKKAMIRWAVYMVIWGFVVPGINNSAHVGGFAVGAALAYVIPLGMVQSVAANRGLSVLVLGMLAVVLLSTGQMLLNVRGYPASLENDREPSGVMFFTVREGTQLEYSSQTLLRQSCEELAEKDLTSEDTERRCELALRADAFSAGLYEILARVHEARGNPERAALLRETLRWLLEHSARNPD
jgi:membrane associated rhomboid family serine protease